MSSFDDLQLSQELQNAGPTARPIIRKSAYLAEALRAMQQTSQGFKTPGSVGMNLLGEALLQYARSKNDKKLHDAEELDTAKQTDAFRLAMGLPDPLAAQPDFPGYQAPGSPVGGQQPPMAPAPAAPQPASAAPPPLPPPPQSAQGGQMSGPDLKAMAYLIRNKAYDPARAAGVVGNLLQESGPNLNLDNPAEGAIGVANWHGSRAAALRAFGGAQPTLEQQLDFLDNELHGPEAKAMKALQAANDPTAAAAAFAGFERPAGWRPGGDPAAISGWGNRVGNAQRLYNAWGAQSPDPYQMAAMAGPGAENAGTPSQPMPQGAPPQGPPMPAGGPTPPSPPGGSGMPPAPIAPGAGGQASPIWQGVTTPQEMEYLTQMARNGTPAQRQAALQKMMKIQMDVLGPPDWVAVPGVSGMFADKRDPTRTMRIEGAKKYVSMPGAPGVMVNENDPSDVRVANVPEAARTHTLTPQQAQGQGYNPHAVVQEGPLGVQNVTQPGQAQTSGLGAGGVGAAAGGPAGPHVDRTGRMLGPDGRPISGYEGFRFQQGPDNQLAKVVEPTPEQRKVARFTQMMTQANDILNGLAQHQHIYKPSNMLTSMMLSGNFQEAALSAEDRQYLNAAKMLTAARLRWESGAAIPPSEVANTMRDFMGIATDDPRTLAQKARERAGMLQGFQNEGGLYYTDMYGQETPQGRVNPPVHAFTDPAGVAALNNAGAIPPRPAAPGTAAGAAAYAGRVEAAKAELARREAARRAAGGR